jgi:tetratricopeptide (TPR) repeat protein
MKRFLVSLLILSLISFVYFKTYKDIKTIQSKPPTTTTTPIVPASESAPTSLNTVTLKSLPETKILENSYHIYQTFNNCGPAALSMTLSYYGINIGQQELGQELRPYQNSQGNNDDKSVSMDELALKASEYGFTTYFRPNGNIDLLKQFISYDIPVITKTRLSENEDIGHFRIVKGYDDKTEEIVQDDSLQGPNLRYSYSQFNQIWQTFNYEYLVLVPQDKEEIAKTIIGEGVDEKTSWENAVENSRKQLETNPNDIYAGFNLSVALYKTGDFKNSVSEFEKVENKLPFRTLWYQIEPIKAYFELGNYTKVFDMADKILNNQNRAFSQLYILRGEIYKKQGNIEAAKSEFEKAVFYNKNLKEAQDLLQSVQ